MKNVKKKNETQRITTYKEIHVWEKGKGGELVERLQHLPCPVRCLNEREKEVRILGKEQGQQS